MMRRSECCEGRWECRSDVRVGYGRGWRSGCGGREEERGVGRVKGPREWERWDDVEESEEERW